jgi:hypothetical protein
MAFMGETTDIGVPELLSVLARRGLTGRLHISANSEEVQVTLEKGQVVQVTSSHHGSRIGRVLVRLGILAEADLERAVRLQSMGRSVKPIGQILTEANLITAADLSRAAQEQATESLARIFGADHGRFFFTDAVGNGRSGLVNLNAEGIVLEASRRADELAMLRSVLPSGQTVFKLDHGQLPTAGRLPEHEQHVIRLIVSRSATIEDIVTDFGDDEVTALRTIVSLRERGILILPIDRGSPQSNPQPASPETTVQPRTAEEINRLMANHTNDVREWAPSINEVRASAASSTHTTALLTRTARDVVAAFNAGLPLLAFAHFSDEFFQRMSDLSDDERKALSDPADPLLATDQQTFIGLKDARTLSDGRVSAIVVTRLPDGPESKKVVLFRRLGDRYVIDAIVESAQERDRHTQTTLLSAAGTITQDNRVLRRHL